MPRIVDLVQIGFNPQDAKHLGVDSAITLTATGTASQANGYPITANYNQFTTVTGAANSATLPLAITSAYGAYVVKNDDSADTLKLFPAVGDTFNALAANASIDVIAGECALVFKVSNTGWVTTNTALINLTTGVTGILPVANGGTGLNNATIAFGTYTPTRTNVANVASSNAYQAQYMRVGTVVTVSGKIDIDPTTNTTVTQIRLSLPVASNFGAQEDCAGTILSSAVAGLGGAIRADTTNDTALIDYVCNNTANNAYFYHYTYEII